MKLLFDQNISYRIIKHLGKYFPESKHISQLGLVNFSDAEIWDFARKNEYVIVTFDADFYDLSVLAGIPPKIIWLRIGNTTTLNISNVLIKNQKLIFEFSNRENENACLEIS
jgi:predicted nuclease of predicted toxin-antitoxin system